MKNSQLNGFLKDAAVAGNFSGRIFSKALYKNIRMIEEYLSDLAKLTQPSKDYEKIQQQINEIYEKYSDKDATYNPPMPVKRKDILPDGRSVDVFVITNEENQKKADAELDKLRVKNRKLFEIQERKLQEYIDEVNDDCQLDFIKVDEEDLPEEITTNQMFLFDFMINFDNEKYNR